MNESFLGIEGDDLAEESAAHHPVEEGVKEKEEEAEDEADHSAFNVGAEADRGGEVADEGLRDAVHADGQVGGGERVFGKADEGAEEEGSDLVLAHEAEIDGQQERQFEPFGIRDEPREIE